MAILTGEGHVGTAALGCPGERSSPGVSFSILAFKSAAALRPAGQPRAAVPTCPSPRRSLRPARPSQASASSLLDQDRGWQVAMLRQLMPSGEELFNQATGRVSWCTRCFISTMQCPYSGPFFSLETSRLPCHNRNNLVPWGDSWSFLCHRRAGCRHDSVALDPSSLIRQPS